MSGGRHRYIHHLNDSRGLEFVFDLFDKSQVITLPPFYCPLSTTGTYNKINIVNKSLNQRGPYPTNCFLRDHVV